MLAGHQLRRLVPLQAGDGAVLVLRFHQIARALRIGKRLPRERDALIDVGQLPVQAGDGGGQAQRHAAAIVLRRQRLELRGVAQCAQAAEQIHLPGHTQVDRPRFGAAPRWPRQRSADTRRQAGRQRRPQGIGGHLRLQRSAPYANERGRQVGIARQRGVYPDSQRRVIHRAPPVFQRRRHCGLIGGGVGVLRWQRVGRRFRTGAHGRTTGQEQGCDQSQGDALHSEYVNCEKAPAPGPAGPRCGRAESRRRYRSATSTPRPPRWTRPRTTPKTRP